MPWQSNGVGRTRPAALDVRFAPLHLSRVCLLFLLGLGPACSPSGEHVAREVVDELLLGPPRFEVLEPGQSAPRAERVMPGVERRADTESLPALVLTPGAQVRFEVDSQLQLPDPRSSQLLLIGAFGPTPESSERLARESGLALTLEVWIGGALVFAERLAGGDAAGWKTFQRPDGTPGLSISPGQEFELRCRAEGPDAERLRGACARLSLATLTPKAGRSSSPRKPNLLLILSDTLRADHLGCYGDERGTSPNLDALAARGVCFEKAYSAAPWTWPSTASIFTGLMPSAHGVQSSLSSYLHGSLTTLAECFARADLRTAAVCGNPLIVAAQNFDQGFEEFSSAEPGAFLDAELLVPAALEQIDRFGDQQFFLYLHLVDAHEPHAWSSEAQQRFKGRKPQGYPAAGMVAVRTNILRKRSTFDADGRSRIAEALSPEFLRFGELTYTRAIYTHDQWLGRLFDGLDARGLTDSTVIAFTSDHGEEYLEHGGLLHGDTLYEEVMHVPLLLAGPGIPAGVRRDRPVSNRFLGGTLAQLLGLSFGGPESVDLLAAEDGSEVRFQNLNGRWHDRQVQPLFGRRSGGQVLLYAPLSTPWGVPADPDQATGEALDLAAWLSDADRAWVRGQSQVFDAELDPGNRDDLAASLEAADPRLLPRSELELLQTFAEEARRAPPSLGQAGSDVEAMLIQMGYMEAPSER